MLNRPVYVLPSDSYIIIAQFKKHFKGYSLCLRFVYISALHTFSPKSRKQPLNLLLLSKVRILMKKRLALKFHFSAAHSHLSAIGINGAYGSDLDGFSVLSRFKSIGLTLLDVS